VGAPFIPDRGTVVWIDANPKPGLEQAGRRRALVLSPAAYNGKVGLALLCPITRRGKGYPFEVSIPGGLPVTGVVLADRVQSLDWRARAAERITELPDQAVAEVLRKLAPLVRVV
jgi:mRNA interferase MazF